MPLRDVSAALSAGLARLAGARPTPPRPGRVRRPARFRTASGSTYELRPARDVPAPGDPAHPRYEPVRDAGARYRPGRHPRYYLRAHSRGVLRAFAGVWLPVESATVDRRTGALVIVLHRPSVEASHGTLPSGLRTSRVEAATPAGRVAP